MSRAPLAVLTSLLLASGPSGCAPPPSGGGGAPPPAAALRGLSAPAPAYREKGLLAQGSPLAFVGAFRFLAGPAPDSTLALLSLSLANRALTFQRAGAAFQASYRVEVVFGSGPARRALASDKTVRVPVFSETQRTEESVIFQQVMPLPPGPTLVDVVVRDQNSGRSSRDTGTVLVQRFATPAVAMVPVYRSEGRAARRAQPDLLLNPRGSVLLGSDTLILYVEAYGAASDRAVALRAVDEVEREVWRVEPVLRGDTALRSGEVRLPPGTLTAGWHQIEALLPAAPDTARVPVLVGYWDPSTVANFEGVLSLLRYFGSDRAIEQLRTAPDSLRAMRWRAFWKGTDSEAGTPRHEAMARYFSRVRVANDRFREGGRPGWFTDRGEVFVTLGEPDEEFDFGSDAPGSRGADPQGCVMSCPAISWRYSGEPLVLIFGYDARSAGYRLDPSSRREFERVVARRRERG